MNSRRQRIFAKVEFVVFVSHIMYESGYVRTLSCIRVDRLQVVFESDSSSLGLLYNVGGTTCCNL